MKVCVFFNDQGSFLTHRRDLISFLTRYYPDLTVFLPGARFFGHEYGGYRRFFFNRGSLGLLDFLNTSRHVYRIIKNEKPDLVVFVSLNLSIIGGITARFAKAKTLMIIPGMGTFFTTQSLQGKFFQILAYSMIRMSRSFLIVQNRDDKLLMENIVGADRIFLIPGSSIVIPPRKPRAASAGKKITITFVGRLLIEKGIQDFLAVAKSISSKRDDVEFLVVGDFDYNNPSHLNSGALEQLPGFRSVAFLGHVDDMESIYRITDVLCLPSYREGFPRVVIEAAAYGIGAVVYDVVGCREAVIDGVTGYVCGRFDIEDMEKRLVELVINRELRLSIGMRARNKAREFSVENIGAQHLAVISNIVNAHHHL